MTFGMIPAAFKLYMVVSILARILIIAYEKNGNYGAGWYGLIVSVNDSLAILILFGWLKGKGFLL